jgi:hypothetical protein
MTREFVNYEQALALKELGFDEPCLGYFENQDMNLVINFNNLPLNEEQSKRPKLYIIDNRNSVLPQWATTAPLYQQAFKWLLDKNKGLNITFYFDGSGVIDDPTPDNTNIMFRFNTLNECLIKLIEIVKK